ncbi:MAG TPA: hypothetical protein DCO86_05110 [Spirochaetaceae bacterium]|nr:hypothetical protein [Spirochaetaceae bacterium]
MAIIRLFHGSDHIVKRPDLSAARPANDYGKGFYCTFSLEMAKEWACKKNTDGFANEYAFDDEGLRILNLLDGKHTVLNWIALLLKHRVFVINDEIALDAKDYIIDNFSVDTTGYDVIKGYRADDSYFSYAQSFVHNALPLRCLGRALRLGELGEQTALVSEKAFDRIEFVLAEPVSKEIYYPKFVARDTSARTAYSEEIKRGRSYRDDIFVMDIIRGEVKSDDPRIQCIILK